MATSTSPRRRGRPIGSGAGTDVAVLDQEHTGSYKLIIGKALWRAIGSPRRVALSRAGQELRIAATDAQTPGTYAVSGPPAGAPACNIGKARCRDVYGLAPGRYPARMDDGALVLRV